jgi:diaminopimelate epimerase
VTQESRPSPFGSLPLAFTKMSGAGNDFLVFGVRVERGPRETEAIRRLCRRGTGVGADGVLFVFAESQAVDGHRR